MKLDLFKYYAPVFEKSPNLSFYEKGAVYFQQPYKFNDPWDCKAPNITIPRQINFPRDFHFYITSQYGKEFSNRTWTEYQTFSRSKIKNIYKDLFEDALKNTRMEIGVFSLSFIPDSELLWSHYAVSHTGYMLHFQISLEEYFSNPKLQDIGIPIPVVYKKRRQKWNLATYETNREKHVYDLIRFKSESWKYECELRLLNEKRFGFIELPEFWLKSITVGLGCGKELREQLVQIGNKINIPVFYAEMDIQEFKIKIPGLGITGTDGIESYNQLILSKKFEFR